MYQSEILENKFIPNKMEDDNAEKVGVSEAENSRLQQERPGGDDTLFTRYLYVKRQVMHSLFLALLEYHSDEAIFWGYELYYSGFQIEAMEFIDSIYTTIYKPCCSPEFIIFFQTKYELWKQDNTQDFILGILIRNLAIRQYDVNYFIEEVFHVKCIKKPEIRNKQFRITSININKYKTHDHVAEKGRFVLQKHCRYKIRNEVDDIFNMNIVDIKNKFHCHWEYYAYECPLWQERIMRHNGVKNDVTEIIDFEHDDDAEEFYDLYGYEPDEQNKSVQEQCIGDQMVKQMSIKEFAQKYGGTIKSKFIIRRNK